MVCQINDLYFLKRNYKKDFDKFLALNNSILEDIIFKNKNDFYLFGNIFINSKTNDKNNINKNCKKLEVEMNFRYGDDDSNCDLDLNNKKKVEEKKISKYGSFWNLFSDLHLSVDDLLRRHYMV